MKRYNKYMKAESDNRKIYYYSVALASSTPWAKQNLTYSSAEKLTSGAIVLAPLGKKTVFGVVVEATKPSDDLLNILKQITPTDHSLTSSTMKFYRWIESYYPSTGSGHLSKFLPGFISQELLDQEANESAVDDDNKLAVSLTADQEAAYSSIADDTSKPIILHGITGSGKTAVYARRILDELDRGNHALVIVPEISLISQLSSSLRKLLPNTQIATYHSSQTAKHNRETWKQAQSTHPSIIVGTRSSLFLPFENLGVVIIDEAHEYSLKEDHENSHYHGLFSAAALAKIHGAQFIIGSATPPIPETYMMSEKGAEIVCMHSIAKTSEHETSFSVIDVSKDQKQKAKSRLISSALSSAIGEALNRSEQTLLFINKLGSAHIIECSDCGWQATCPQCDTNFIYHHDTHSYRCTVCDTAKKAENACPDCGGTLKSRSLAIKSVEVEAQKLFPTAKIARFDSTNKKSESIGELYNDVHDGQYDIIIGTQLMAKGFDFPKLSTVGVLNADALLSLPDVNTEERLFAQLVQVAGRVGRGHRKSEVYIQTRQADNPVFELVKHNNWHEVYEKEIVRRKKYHYPPDVFMAKITISGSSEVIAKNRAQELLSEIPNGVSATDPFQAFYHKRKNKYYWQIICKSKKRDELLKLTALRNKYVDIDFDPITLL